MKFLSVIFLSLFLIGCATDDLRNGLMPRGTTEARAPWGYTDMCDDPERSSDVHCPEDEEEDDQ